LQRSGQAAWAGFGELFAFHADRLGPTRRTKGEVMATLPSEPDPFDLALVKLLMDMSGTWQKPDLDSFSQTQEKALSRMTQAGLVQERLDITATMRGFLQQVRMQCCVTGQYDNLLMKRIFEYVPEWLTPDGKTRSHFTLYPDFLGARLTRDGELAQHDGRQGNLATFLLFVRGHGGVKQKYGAGQCLIERIWQEPFSQESASSAFAGPQAVAHATASIGEITVKNQVTFDPQIVVNINGVILPSASPADTGQASNDANSTPPTAQPGEGEGNGKAGNTTKKTAKQKRGRKIETDPKADKRIADAWATRRYKTYAELGQELKIAEREVYLALERHRARKKRRSRSRK